MHSTGGQSDHSPPRKGDRGAESCIRWPVSWTAVRQQLADANWRPDVDFYIFGGHEQSFSSPVLPIPTTDDQRELALAERRRILDARHRARGLAIVAVAVVAGSVLVVGRNAWSWSLERSVVSALAMAVLVGLSATLACRHSLRRHLHEATQRLRGCATVRRAWTLNGQMGAESAHSYLATVRPPITGVVYRLQQGVNEIDRERGVVAVSILTPTRMYVAYSSFLLVGDEFVAMYRSEATRTDERTSPELEVVPTKPELADCGILRTVEAGDRISVVGRAEQHTMPNWVRDTAAELGSTATRFLLLKPMPGHHRLLLQSAKGLRLAGTELTEDELSNAYRMSLKIWARGRLLDAISRLLLKRSARAEHQSDA